MKKVAKCNIVKKKAMIEALEKSLGVVTSACKVVTLFCKVPIFAVFVVILLTKLAVEKTDWSGNLIFLTIKVPELFSYTKLLT